MRGETVVSCSPSPKGKGRGNKRDVDALLILNAGLNDIVCQVIPCGPCGGHGETLRSPGTDRGHMVLGLRRTVTLGDQLLDRVAGIGPAPVVFSYPLKKEIESTVRSPGYHASVPWYLVRGMREWTETDAFSLSRKACLFAHSNMLCERNPVFQVSLLGPHLDPSTGKTGVCCLCSPKGRPPKTAVSALLARNLSVHDLGDGLPKHVVLVDKVPEFHAVDP
ncbi:hypothetical protein BGZ63DRAFT_398351 [Mariannaea sp. PMI_226]|nr:hypothetical protein BGZ63DRAFT_398351 [Mariannaea sp. PMI_226]